MRPRSQTNTQTAPSASPRWALWRNRDYLLLWSGQTVSTLGSGISTIAFPFLILGLTGSPALAGIAGALRSLPYILFSLPVGALIDRWDRKWVMILCDAGRAIALGSIPFAVVLGHLTIAHLFVVTFVEGALFVFFDLAEVACLPRVVRPEQLPAATGQNQATIEIAGLLSSPLGGLLYSTSRLLPFLVDALSYGASVISLFAITTRFQGERSTTTRRLGAEIREGVVWLWTHPLIRSMALLTGGNNFVFAGAPLIIIVLAQHQGATPLVTGLIFSLFSVGGIIGSLLGTTIQKRFTFAQVIIAVVVSNAVLWPLYALAPTLLIVGVIGALLFVLNPIYNVVQISYRLTLIPDALQGRVNSVFRLLAFGFQPLGAAFAGILLQQMGPQRTILIYGAVLFFMALTTVCNPSIRRARPLVEARGEV